MKFKKSVAVTLFVLFLLMISAVNAASDTNDTLNSNLNDVSVSHIDNSIDVEKANSNYNIHTNLDVNDDSISHEEDDIDVIEKESISNNILKANKDSKKLSSSDKTVLKEDEFLWHKVDDNTWIHTQYNGGQLIDKLEVHLSPLKITEGDNIYVNIKHEGSFKDTYLVIDISTYGKKREATKYFVNNGQISTTIKLPTGENSIWYWYVHDDGVSDLVAPYTIIVKPKATPTKTKKTTKYKIKKVKKGKTYKYGKYKGKFTKKQINSIINAKNKGKYKTVTVNTGKTNKYKYYTYKRKTKYKTAKFGHNVQTFEEEAFTKKGWTLVKYWWGKKTYWDPNLGYWHMVYGKFKKVTYVKVKKSKKYKVKMSLSTTYEDGWPAGKNKAVLSLWSSAGKIREKQVKI